MAKFFAASFTFALLLLGASNTAHAWASQGHYLVGELAERHLDPAAKAEVERLLAGEKDPTLGGVASWADNLRQTDPDRFKATSRWHYVNAKGGGCAFEVARDCPDGNCVVAAIEKQRAILADRSQPLEARRDALKFVVHFVGDVHQPLHAGSHTDAGGNGYQISLRTTIQPEEYARKSYVNGVMGTNLHSVWDYYIPASRSLANPAYSDALDDLRQPPTPASAIASLTPMDWAKESCGLIDEPNLHLYPQGHKLDHGYLDEYRPLAEQRIRAAAWRLARLLNESLSMPR